MDWVSELKTPDDSYSSINDLSLISNDNKGFVEHNLNIRVSDVTDPIITSATTATFTENGTGTAYTITATDDGAITYSLGTGNDEALFNVDATSGEVTFKSAPDFETPIDANTDNAYAIEVKASDGVNQINQTVTITVTDVDDTNPVFTSATTATFVENGTGTAYTALATDVNTVTYSIDAGDDGDKFDIVGATGVVTFKYAPDFESPSDVGLDNTYLVRIIARDDVGNSTNQTVTITVTNVSDVNPTFTSTAVTTINDNATYIYAITTSDADGDAVTVTANTKPSWLNLSEGQAIVRTIAGSSVFGSAEGTGAAASFWDPRGIVVDAVGNIYVADQQNNRIRIIDTQGVTSTWAGSTSRGLVDGTGTEARFFLPSALAIDADGNIYVADSGNHTIRKISPSGVVTTLAGSFGSGADGIGTSALFNNPAGLAVDSEGNVYVSDDQNYSIRKITPEGVVTTLAGSGNRGSSNGTGTEAEFDNPRGLAVGPDGNIYLADRENNLIRKITPEGVVTTFVGSGNASFADGTGSEAEFYNPVDVVFDPSGNLYVLDQFNQRIRKVTAEREVTTVAGSSFSPIVSVDGIGTSASFYFGYHMTADQNGDLYVAQTHSIRKIEITEALLSGNPTDQLGTHSVVLDAADGNGGTAQQSFTITVLDATDPVFTSATTATFTENGTGTAYIITATDASAITYSLGTGNDEALFNINAGVITFNTPPDFEAPLDANTDNAYVIEVRASDGVNEVNQTVTITVTDVDDTNPVFTSLITATFTENATGVAYTAVATDTNTLTYSLGACNDENLFNINTTSGEVTFKSAPDFETPTDTNTDNDYVIEVNASDGVNEVSQIVTITVTDVEEIVFEFKSTPIVSVNEDEEYVYSVLTSKPDESIFSLAQGPDWLKLRLTGKVTSTTGIGSAFTKDGIGNIYAIDGNQIKRVDAVTGEITLLAGIEDYGSLDGTGVNASFYTPMDIEFGPDGLLYIADMRNGLIRRVTLEGEVSIFAGTRFEDIPSSGPYSRPEVINGDRLEAIFFWPIDIEFDTSGNMYIADSRNHIIRKIDISGQVTNFAGKYNIKTRNVNGLSSRVIDPGYLDGASDVALFNTPSAISIDAANNVYVTDQYNHKIRKISSQGMVTTIAGGIEGYQDGGVGDVLFSAPTGIIVDTKNRIFVGEASRIRMIDANGLVSTIAGGSSGTGLVDGIGSQAKLRNTRSMRQGADDQLILLHGSEPKFRIIDMVNVLSGNPLEHVGDHEVSLVATDSNSEFIYQNFTLQVRDHIAPFISEIVRIDPIEETIKTDRVAFRVKFSEKVLNVDVTDFEISFNSAENLAINITKDIFDETLYTIKINVAKTGLIDLNLKASTDITDIHGNELVNLTPTDLEETFLVQANNAPTIDSTPVLEVDDNQAYEYELVINDIDFDSLSLNNSVLPSWLKIESEHSVETLAGSVNGFQNGVGVSAKFNEILGLASDGFGNTYVAEKNSNSIRKITPEGEVTSFASVYRRTSTYNGGTTSAMHPSHVTIADDGVFYISTYSFGTIERMTSKGEIFTLAGSEPGYADGQGADAKFSNPLGSAIDQEGNLIVADAGNHLIRKITPSGLVTTLAGSTRGYSDGSSDLSQFSSPTDVAIDKSGNIYIVDSGNNRIRKIDQSGNVTTFAGSSAGYADGLGQSAQFKYPLFLAIDPSNNLYVTDRFNDKVRKIDASGNVSTIAGSTSGFNDGSAEESKFNTLAGIAIDHAGNIIVADAGNSRIRKISKKYILSGSAIGQSGTHDVSLSLNDNNEGTVYQNFQIEINDVTAPIVTSPATISFTENATGTAYTVTATDTNTITYSLGTNNDEALFNINAGVITFNTSPDFEEPLDANTDNVYVIEVGASDGVNQVNQTVTITVTDVDDTNPVFTSLITASFAENGTGVAYTAVATDTNTLSYSLGACNDENLFNINAATGEVTFKSSPDFESATDSDSDNTYVIEIRVSDGINEVSQTVIVSVADSNDPPLLTGNGRDFTYTEAFQSGISTLLFENISVSTVEPDQLITSFSIELTNIAAFPNAGSFESFDGSTIWLSNSRGTTQNNGLEMRREVISGVNTMTFTKESGITTDVFNTILNNVKYNYAGRDPDVENVRTFVLKTIQDNGSNEADNNNTGTFAITSNVTLIGTDTEPYLSSSPLNPTHYVGNNPVSLFKDTNASAVESSQKISQIEFTVNNLVYGAEELIFIDGQQFTLTDGESGVTVNNSITVNIELVDDIATVRLSASQGLSDDSTIDLINGITYSNTNQSPVAGTREVTLIKVIDTGNNTGNDRNEQVFSISSSINLLNETVPPPVFTSAATVNFTENGTGVVYTAQVTSVNTVTYGFGTDNDEALFDFGAASGEVVFKSSPDFESPIGLGTDNTYVIEINANDGVNSVSKTVNISVTNLNEAPVFTSTPITEIDDNETYGYNITVTDPENDKVVISASEIPSWLNLKNETLDEVDIFAGSRGGYMDGTGVNASFANPYGLAIDNQGNIFVADNSNHRIRKISKEGVVSTFAGSGVPGYSDGNGLSAQFYRPYDIAVDHLGYLYVSDWQNNRIRKISPDGEVTTMAGSGDDAFRDGQGVNASFSNPMGIDVDKSGNVFVADFINGRIRKIAPSGEVTTIAGNGSRGHSDGIGTSASFDGPSGLAVDLNGYLYVSDQYNHSIRKIAPDGMVTTLVWSGNGGVKDGDPGIAYFQYPSGIAVDDLGVVFVADNGNRRIRRIDQAGVTTTIIGNGTDAYSAGIGVQAGIGRPSGIAVDSNGELYISSGPYVLKRSIGKTFIQGISSAPSGPHSVLLEARDELGNVSNQSFTITVNDVTAPIFTSAATATFTENGTGTAYTVTATDASAIIYSLGTDNDEDFFDISAGEVSYKSAPDYETKSNYTIVVKASDGLYTASQTVTITIADVDEIAPVFTSATTVSFIENGTEVVYTSIATDNSPLTYSLGDGNDESFFNINATSGELIFKSAPDFETKNSYIIVINANDGFNTVSQTVTITIVDVDEIAPVFTSTTKATFTENGTGAAYTVKATDANAITYSLGTGNDEALFTIANGVIAFRSAPNYEDPKDANKDNAYIIKIKANDGKNESIHTVTITVTDLEEIKPVVTLTAEVNGLAFTPSVKVSLKFSEAITGLEVTDFILNNASISNLEGTGDTYSFTLNSILDGNASVGLKANTIIDAQNNSNLASPILNQSFEARNELPTEINLSTSAIAENIINRTEIGSLSTNDVDVGDLHSYKLVSGSGSTNNDLFDIVGNKLFKKAGLSFNYEDVKSLSVRIQVADLRGGTYETAKTITVADVAEPTAALTIVDATNIELGGNSIIFDLVKIGASKTRQVKIKNTSPDASLQVSNIKLPVGFSASESNFTLGIGQEKTVNITFSPTDDQFLLNRLEVISNADVQQLFVVGKGLKNRAPIAMAPSVRIAHVPGSLFKLIGYDPEGELVDFVIVEGPSLGTLTARTQAGEYTFVPNGLSPETVYEDQVIFKAVEQGGGLSSQEATVRFKFRVPDSKHTLYPITIEPKDENSIDLVVKLDDQVINNEYFISGFYRGKEEKINKTFRENIAIPKSAFIIDGSTLTYKVSLSKTDYPALFTNTKVLLGVSISTTNGFHDSKAQIFSRNTAGNLGGGGINDDSSIDGNFSVFSVDSSVPENETVNLKLSAVEFGDFDLSDAVVAIVKGPISGTVGSPKLASSKDGLTEWTIAYTSASEIGLKDSVQFSVTHKGRNETLLAYARVQVTDVPDAPTLLDINDQSMDEDKTLSVGFTATDPDSQLSYQVISSNSNVTGTVVDGKIELKATNDFNGNVNVQLLVTEVGSSSPQVVTDDFTLVIVPVNDAPIMGDIQNQTVAEDNQLIIPLSATDIDGNVSVFNYLASSNADNNVSYKIENGSLTVTPKADFFGELEFTVNADDGTGTKTALSTGKTFKVTVTPVNDSPILSKALNTQALVQGFPTYSLDLANFFEDKETAAKDLTYTVSSISNVALSMSGSVLTITSSNGNVGLETAKLTVSDGQLTTLQDLNFLTAVNSKDITIANSISDITLQEDFGLKEIDLSTVFSYAINPNAKFAYSLAGNQNLSASINGSKIELSSVADFNGLDKLYVTAMVEGKASMMSFNITVSAVNDVPTLVTKTGDQSILEDAVFKKTISSSSFADIDNDALTYSASYTASWLSFDPITRTFSGTPDNDNVGEVTVTLTATDPSGGKANDVFKILVTNVNDAPTAIYLASNTMDENTALGTVISGLSSIDVDAGDNIFTYQLVSGVGSTDNDKFALTNGNLVLAASVDYEKKSSYSIRLRTTDGFEGSFEQAMTIKVKDVNESPTGISLSSAVLTENAAIGTLVGNLASVDEDSGDTHVYSLVAGTGDTDNTQFTIQGGVLKSASALDFESKSSYSVRFRTTDSKGLFFEKQFSIAVNDVNETATAISLDNAQIMENNQVGGIIGGITTTDQDTGDTHSYALVNGTGDTDNASFEILGNKLVAKTSFDFETKTSYSTRIKTTDAGGLSFENSFVISITNQAEAILRLEGGQSAETTNVGETTTIEISIFNDGDDVMEVSSITYPNGFTGPAKVEGITPSTSKSITISFAPSEAKTYTGDIVFNYNGGSGIKSVVAVAEIVASIYNGFIDELAVSIYPNPANDRITLDLIQYNGKPVDILILNESGLQLYNISNIRNTSHDIEVGNYLQGIYIVLVKSEVGVVRKKLIIFR
ncbi:putative Ig domain-containing protein [Roseivirga sp.]|uniref:NHL domain-containing protein n=1 Tax=Roseivirga sp. TaxID=1964215 RepID=UPI002B2662D1|nr:Ig-like domain-containing protein [Roseivirga sp.]